MESDFELRFLWDRYADFVDFEWKQYQNKKVDDI